MKKYYGIPYLLAIICFLAAMLIAQPAAFAPGGDGSGGGKSIPFDLDGCNITNGQTGVSVRPEIKLTFNKNVVNMMVKENNKRSLTLVDGAGNNVALQVLMADDQTDPVFKRDITLVPVSELAPGSAYTLSISAGMQAKNGSSLGRNINVSFTTAGEAVPGQAADEEEIIAPEEDEETAEETADDLPVGEEEPSLDEASAQQDVPLEQSYDDEAVEQTTGAAGERERNVPWPAAALAIIVIAAALGVLLVRNNRLKKDGKHD